MLETILWTVFLAPTLLIVGLVLAGMVLTLLARILRALDEKGKP